MKAAEMRAEPEQDEEAAWQPRIIGFLCFWCSYTGGLTTPVRRG